MPPKKNPLNLNPLQLKTLTLLQELARLEGHAAPADAHGDHFHLGGSIVLSQDATGLGNEAVWVALQRKGLIRSQFPVAAILTPAGLGYETGLRDRILHRGHD